MLEDNEIEISFELDIKANVATNISRDKWEAATDEQKRKIILNMIDDVSIYDPKA